MLAFTPFVQVATYATRHFATFGLAPAAAPICDVLEMSLILTMLLVALGSIRLSASIHQLHGLWVALASVCTIAAPTASARSYRRTTQPSSPRRRGV
jgi:hypothetical protein